MLLLPLLIVGFILIVGFFLCWYAVVTLEKIKKKKLKKTYYVLWGAGIPMAVGGLVMIICGLLLK